MKQDISQIGFADLVAEKRLKKHTFSERIDQIIDWAPIKETIDACYDKGTKIRGRRSFDGLVLFKLELLRLWYRLSDTMLETQVNDKLSFTHFAGLSLQQHVPDTTTLRRFRHALTKAGVYDTLMEEINHQLEHKHFHLRRGSFKEPVLTVRKHARKNTTSKKESLYAAT